MAYYDALAEKWASTEGTNDEKLSAINAETVPGPRTDVQVSSVFGRLLLTGAYWNLAGFAQATPTGDAGHDGALFSAKSLLLLLNSPNAPAFSMSDPMNYATISGMLGALAAWEAANPGTTGITQQVHDVILGLCETRLPWWQASGYTSAVSENDLIAAGIVPAPEPAPEPIPEPIDMPIQPEPATTGGPI